MIAALFLVLVAVALGAGIGFALHVRRKRRAEDDAFEAYLREIAGEKG